MIKIILSLIMLFNFSYSHSSDIGIGLIVLYLINNQNYNHALISMEFQKKEMTFFKLVRKLNTPNPPYYPMGRLKNIHDIFRKHQCSMTDNEAVTKLIEKNTLNTVLKITYSENHYTYYYSEPLNITGCDLVLEYEEKDTPYTIPNSGSGSLMIFEIKDNKLNFLMAEEKFHMD